MAYVIGAVLAAGRGVRMGGPKATLIVGGQRLIDRAIATLIAGWLRSGHRGRRRGRRRSVTVPPPSSIPRPNAACVPPSPWRSRPAPPEQRRAMRHVDHRARRGRPGRTARRHARDRRRGSPLGDRALAGRPEPNSGRPVRRRPTGPPHRDGDTALAEVVAARGCRRGRPPLPGRNGDLIDEVQVAGDPADLDHPEDLRAWHERQ